MEAEHPIPISLVRSSYQPSKEEMEELVEIHATPEKLARAVVRPVDITWNNRPE